MTHYICTGECKGVSDNPCKCNDKACSLHKKPLVKCECEEDRHSEL